MSQPASVGAPEVHVAHGVHQATHRAPELVLEQDFQPASQPQQVRIPLEAVGNVVEAAIGQLVENPECELHVRVPDHLGTALDLGVPGRSGLEHAEHVCTERPPRSR